MLAMRPPSTVQGENKEVSTSTPYVSAIADYVKNGPVRSQMIAELGSKHVAVLRMKKEAENPWAVGTSIASICDSTSMIPEVYA